ncbi:MAG: B12-binding domain-containing radical SAM protein [Candidatus Xenobiia bacterium LiM19]
MPDGRILVIVPRYTDSDEPDYFYYFPIGVAYVVSALVEGKLPIEVVNFNHMRGSSPVLVKAALDREQFSIVVTGGNNLFYPELKRIITAAREHPSHPLTVLGGPLVTTEPELAFDNIRPDYGVIGEAEEMIADLLSSLLSGDRPENIPGTVFERNGTIMQVPPREISDVNTIRLPEMDMVGYREWMENAPSNFALNALPLDKPRVYPLIGSRDCPFQCTFCYHHGKYRERSIDNIFAELEDSVRKYRINFINCFDDCFAIKPERVKEFCRRMTSLRNSIDWPLYYAVQFTVKEFDEEMCRLLKESGCNTLAFGFESYNKTVLASMRKPIKPAEIDRALRLALKYNFILYALFIFGDTAETTETYRETLEYWKKNAEGQVRLDMIRIFPGSAIYKDSVRRGLIKDKIAFMTHDMPSGKLINFTEKMSDQEYQLMIMEMNDAKRRFMKYVIPESVTHSDRYSRVVIKCPYCRELSDYDHVLIRSHVYFCQEIVCRHCSRRFYIRSLLSLLWMYQKCLRYSIIKFIGVKRLWPFKFLFNRLDTH